MYANTVRRGVLVFITASMFGASAFIIAQTPANKPVARFTATSDNVSGAGDTIRIDLLRWSTDAERDQFLAAWNMTGAPARGGGRGAGAGGGAPAAGGRGGAARGGQPGAAAQEPTTDPASPVNQGNPANPANPANPPAGGDQTAPAAANAAGAAGGAAGGDAAAGGRGGRGGGGGRGGRGGGGGGGRGGDARGGAAPAAPQTPESSLLAALQSGQTVGYVWTSESAGYSIRYAYRVAMPDGGERIILATDRRLGAWNPHLWKPAGSAPVTDYQFTVLELRLNRNGQGEGKASLTAKVAVDKEANTIALENYSAAPVVLKGVKR